MTKLALVGGPPAVKGTIRPFNTIGKDEVRNAQDALMRPLSGFLGGQPQSGLWVSTLEDLWKRRFKVTHAIACNSATSGLLAACRAIEIGQGTEVLVSPFTMSATAAAPAMLGANVKFVDIEAQYFCMDPVLAYRAISPATEAIIATNLFGHPAELQRLAKYIHAHGGYLIEDNSQSPFAMENGSYAGTIGDIGVFSLNVHKHIQCGEGGIVVTDNDEFAAAIRRFINHGEMAGDSTAGLNLRMTEVTAAIACAQLEKSEWIVDGRIALAEAIMEELKDVSFIKLPETRENCRHVYYVLPLIIHGNVSREWAVRALRAEGVPICEGYVAPLHTLPAFSGRVMQPPYAPIGRWKAAHLHYKSMIYFEICAHDPSEDQIKQIGEAFRKVEAHAHSQG